ncbi:MAG: flagellar protein FlaG [Burkholderiales bacterium]|nr:flagellar protein FlaG [Burkholderiales bacterium]
MTAAPVREPTAPSPQDLQKMLAEAQTLLTSRAANLEFSLDDETGKTVVRVVDKETQEVIRQFPSEEMLAVARNLQRIQGFLLEDRA